MKKTILIALVILMLAVPIFAEEIDLSADKSAPKKRLLLMPYPFFNDTIGSGLGVAAIAEGYVQPQVFSVGSALYSTDGNYLLFLMMKNYQLPLMKRIFLEPKLSFGEFKDIQAYRGTNPRFPNEIAGSNNSSDGNFTESDGSDYWIDFNIKYLLPIGSGRDRIIPKYKLNEGIVAFGQTGGDGWNPFESGRTYIELEPFFRDRDLDKASSPDSRTAGIEVALTYDNTDFSPNPSRGNYLRAFFDRDWGAFDSTAPWSVWGGEFSQYYSLGASNGEGLMAAMQRVIAFNFWTVDSPTWNDSHMENGSEVFHRPPAYKGANLGGLWRLRGYPATRFSDRAGIHYGLEYRHTLKWNPLKRFTLNGRLDIDWIQLVGFAETGRVAPDWELDTLHEDMQWSGGVGLRTLVNNLTLRFDFAGSDEDMIAQLFIGQPWPKR